MLILFRLYILLKKLKNMLQMFLEKEKYRWFIYFILLDWTWISLVL